MNIYKDYIQEIEERKNQGLNPKPIDGADLLSNIIEQIKDLDNEYRKDSLNFFIYNVVPGTTPAAQAVPSMSVWHHPVQCPRQQHCHSGN